jgi:hypothetical protein
MAFSAGSSGATERGLASMSRSLGLGSLRDCATGGRGRVLGRKASPITLPLLLLAPIRFRPRRSRYGGGPSVHEPAEETRSLPAQSRRGLPDHNFFDDEQLSLRHRNKLGRIKRPITCPIAPRDVEYERSSISIGHTRQGLV